MEDITPTTPTRPGMTLKQVVEALVFASQKPLTPKEIVATLRSAVEMSEDESVALLGKSKEAEITTALEELRDEYETLDRSFQLIEEVSGWRLLSKARYGLWVRQLFPENRPTRLSAPALETLAIIAYRQPITKADIEAVRGVAVDGVLQTLLDRGLVKIAGRADIAGRPLLYETTHHFLEHFGLKTTDELPNAEELKRIPLPTAAEVEPKKSKSKALDPEEAPATAAAAESTPDSEVLPDEGTTDLFPTQEVSEEEVHEALEETELVDVPDESDEPVESDEPELPSEPEETWSEETATQEEDPDAHPQ